MLPPTDARALLGSLLVVGFEGTTLPARLATSLAAGHRGGVILFKRNLPDDVAARALPRAVHAAAGGELEPLVAIDQEGGRVVRLPSPFRALPPMRVLGRGPAALVRLAGRAVGRELRALGFNLDFAPVLDVDSNPQNPVIGDRSFGSDPHRVAELGVAFAEGLNEGGVLACGKHFPGHGDTDTDSHFDLPVVRHDHARLEAVELLPFRVAARAAMDAFMSAHMVVEAFDGERPATLSKRIMTQLLREELHFSGAVFSDDLEMKAIAARIPIEEAAPAAILAGCDALLVCKSEELADRAHAALVNEAETSPAFRTRAEEAWRRMVHLRRRATELKEDAAGKGEDRSLLDLWDDVARDIAALEVIETP